MANSNGNVTQITGSRLQNLILFFSVLLFIVFNVANYAITKRFPVVDQARGNQVRLSQGSFPSRRHGGGDVTMDISETLVIFSGPRTFADENNDKTILYWANFHYFIEHGISCMEDVVIVVGYPVVSFVQRKISRIQTICKEQGHTVMLVGRGDRCYDMESIRVALELVTLSDYRYFVIMNDGVTGPKVPATDASRSWTHVFTDLMNDRVKMSGLSINCRGHINHLDPHVNSFLYAFDYTGLHVALSAGCFYDCQKEDAGGDDRWSIITRYEIGMSRSILQAGYEIASFIQNFTLDNKTLSDCQNTDVWYRHEMYRWWGKIPSLNEFHFFKTSRFVPDLISKELGYTRQQVFQEEEAFWNAEIIEEGLGGRSIMRYMDQRRHKVHVFVLVTLCMSVDWVGTYFANVRVTDYVIISQCDKLLDVPPGAKILSVSNVSADYIYASLINELVEDREGQSKYGDDIVFFLSGAPTTKVSWMAEEVVNGADVKGFACKRRPHCSPRCKNKYQPTVLHIPEYWALFSLPSDGNGTTKRELGEWSYSLGAKLPSTLIPVCYGRSFAFRRKQLSLQSMETWSKLESVLSKGSPEDAYFAERIWAALLSTPLQPDKAEALHQRTKTVLGDGINRETFMVRQWKLEMGGMLLWDPL